MRTRFAGRWQEVERILHRNGPLSQSAKIDQHNSMHNKAALNPKMERTGKIPGQGRLLLADNPNLLQVCGCPSELYPGC